MTAPDEFAIICDICQQSIEDTESMDAETFSNARNPQSGEIYIMLRCRGCRATTRVCEGGMA